MANAGYVPMTEWSAAACAGASSFGMSGTNAYALTVQPADAPAGLSAAKAPVWQRSRCGGIIRKLLYGS